MSNPAYDLLVIGAGPGGYVCAIRAAQLGLKTALVDKRAELGGTCLNIGCIPSKALLHATELYHNVRDHGADMGIQSTGLKPDLPTLMRHKEQVVSKLCGGVKQLVSKRSIDFHQGTATLLGEGLVGVGDQRLRARHIVIATGSIPAELPSAPFDGERIVSSDQAIAFDSIPKRLVVVGGGAIGLELGSVWARLGSEVTVLEFLPHIAPACDADIAKLLTRALKKQGITCQTGTALTNVEKLKTKLNIEAKQGDKSLKLEADKLLVCVGRKPCTEGLGLEALGLALDERGRIPVDAHFRTQLPNVYAIGDVIAGPMLAHKAEEEGVALAEQLAGKAGHVNYAAIPNVIYTAPEVATVGLGEDAAKKEGRAVKVGKFALAANGRALASGATDGLVKVIAEEKTDRLLGVQMLAHNASEIIGSAVTHLEYGGSAEDLARTVTAHPTIAEALKEAALAVDDRALHAL